MKSRFMSIVIFLFILLLFFYTYNFFYTPQSIATFQSYTSPSHKIDKKLVELFNSEDMEVKKEAKKKILETTLTAIQYEKWQELADYIDLRIYVENVLPKGTEQLILVLNLSKDLAAVAVFEAIADEYVLHSKIENIMPVDKIEFLPIASYPYKMMFIYQTLDEKFGANFYEEFVDVYFHLSNDFMNIWNKTLYYEEIYKEVWLDPQADQTLWNRVVEDTTISFTQDNPMKINTITTFEKYTTHSLEYPNAEQFTLALTSHYRRSYYWNNKFTGFIIGEVTKDVFLFDIALLEDLSMSREALYGIFNNNYKVVTSKGELLYLPKNKFQAMFQSFLEE